MTIALDIILYYSKMLFDVKQNNIIFQRNFNKNFSYCVVVFHFDHYIDVYRQSGGRVIHEIRCVALRDGGRIGCSAEN